MEAYVSRGRHWKDLTGDNKTKSDGKVLICHALMTFYINLPSIDV